MINVLIPKKRKCPGTFDNYGVTGILSFESHGQRVNVEFTKQSWAIFLDDMNKAKWKKLEHHGQC